MGGNRQQNVAVRMVRTGSRSRWGTEQHSNIFIVVTIRHRPLNLVLSTMRVTGLQ